MNDFLCDQPILIRFYPTATYECSYLPGRDARSLVASPAEIIDGHAYGQLIQHGFRRSGLYVYRPACHPCHECVPVRLDVQQFQPHRNQRRAVKRHANLTSHLQGLEFVDEHFELYRRYQAARHAGGGMDQDDREQYENFILCSNVTSFLVEFREDGKLRMVSLIDQIEDGLSSVYTFFDPDVPAASYGVYNVIWQAGLARQLGLPWLYLGYWIRNSRKMAYKTTYQPLQAWREDNWHPLTPDN
ncbi:arginine-tRNA-protein transferase [Formivibrio citricus]|uniref:Aspartate/glutamate leucyltransferase n=1 Tax=Formivibrio citricus TaxID=83765 RepID=A0A1I4WI51_9NEIS|nr:arginyltransferase [Formivibrio citricus]SFN12689.1 arginine-tRNA-protein transferase [Formivibrio citricus]